jgi:hypothetical protein
MIDNDTPLLCSLQVLADFSFILIPAVQTPCIPILCFPDLSQTFQTPCAYIEQSRCVSFSATGGGQTSL